MKEISKWRERIEKERDREKMLIFGIVFLCM
jgi:hypothetical protein